MLGYPDGSLWPVDPLVQMQSVCVKSSLPSPYWPPLCPCPGPAQRDLLPGVVPRCMLICMTVLKLITSYPSPSLKLQIFTLFYVCVCVCMGYFYSTHTHTHTVCMGECTPQYMQKSIGGHWIPCPVTLCLIHLEQSLSMTPVIDKLRPLFLQNKKNPIPLSYGPRFVNFITFCTLSTIVYTFVIHLWAE